MNKPDAGKVVKNNTFKQVDVGQRVTLDEAYLAQMQERHNGEKNRRIFKTAEIQVKEILQKAQAEAQAIIAAAHEQARAEAEEIVERDGRQQCERICLEAYDIGYQKGMEDGNNQIREDLTELVRLGESLTQAAYEAQQAVFDRQKQHMMGILTCVLNRVLAHELETQPQQFIGIIEAAISQLAENGTAKIRVHPDTLAAMLAHTPEVANNQFFTLYASPLCDRDEVHLETLTQTFNIAPENQAQIYLEAVKTYVDKTTDSSIEEAGTTALLEADELLALPQDPIELSDDELLS